MINKQWRKFFLVSISLLVVVFLAWLLYLQDTKQDKGIVGQSQSEQTAQAAVTPVKPLTAADNLWGPLQAPVQLIVYTDLYCQFCNDYFATLTKAKEEFGQQLVIGLRLYPLPIYPQSFQFAEAAECAADQDKFWPAVENMVDMFGKNVNNLGAVLSKTSGLDLDQAQLATCLTEHQHQSALEASMAEAETFGVVGVPTSFLNGQLLPGAYQLDDFSDPSGQSYRGLRNLIKDILANQD